MSTSTAIEWTDATWNPIVGCSIVSKGCTNCYAMRVAGARTSHTAKYTGLTQPSKGGPVWTGEVRLWEKALTQPLSWREPRRVFVNSMGDLFHEAIPDEWIDRCFAVMALAPQHTFQILTKRPERMREYMSVRDLQIRWLSAAKVMALPANIKFQIEEPLPNVWLGVSTEDQATADERIPILLDTPAAVRFISAEPLLGPIDLRFGVHHHPDNDPTNPAVQAIVRAARKHMGPVLDWVIVGGESGRGARPMHPLWARSLRDQCRAAGVPFFFKQWGGWLPLDEDHFAELRRSPRDSWMILDRTGDVDIPDDRWPDEEAGEVAVIAAGKKIAGRILDGREWNEFPEVA